MQIRYIFTACLVVLAGCGRSDGQPEQVARADGGVQPVQVVDTMSPAGDFGVPGAVRIGVDGRTGTMNGEGGASAAPTGSAGVGAAAGTPSGSGGAAGGTGATAGAPATAPAPPGTAANDILERAERAYAQVRSLQADFVQEVYVPLLDSTQRSRGTIFHRTPDRFLMRFTDPQGDVIVADGQHVWMYYPSTDPRQVMRSTLATGGQQFDLHREFLSDASRRYNATRAGTENVGGRPAHALTLIPRGPSPYTRVRLWVDTQDFLVRRFEIEEQNESRRRLDLSNLRPNVTLSDDLFRFTPPAGAVVYDP